MIEQGTRSSLLGTLAGRAKKTGEPVKNDGPMFLSSAKEKAVSFQGYIDTAADVLAMS